MLHKVRLAVALLVAGWASSCVLLTSGLRGGAPGPDGGTTDADRDPADADDGGGVDAEPDADHADEPDRDHADEPDQDHADGGATASMEPRLLVLPCVTAVDDTSCVASPTPLAATTRLEARAAGTYSVTIRVRGVVEQNAYVDGSLDGPWYVGGRPDNEGWNVFRLEVSSPAQSYFLNPGATGILRCFLLDYSRTVEVDAGATLTITADPADGLQVRNVDGSGLPLVVPEIAPAPDIDSQFVQVEAVSISP